MLSTDTQTQSPRFVFHEDFAWNSAFPGCAESSVSVLGTTLWALLSSAPILGKNKPKQHILKPFPSGRLRRRVVRFLPASRPVEQHGGFIHPTETIQIGFFLSFSLEAPY